MKGTGTAHLWAAAMTAALSLSLAGCTFEALEASRYCRGTAFLSSNIGGLVPCEEVLGFAHACDLNLVVIDFAWITYHWPRTDLGAVEDLSAKLKKAGIQVAAMYRPRASRPSEALLHYASNADGSIPGSHNDLCFAHEDSVAWACQWGRRMLSALPSVDTVIVYNLKTPCCCPRCRRGQGSRHAAHFLERCRREWRAVRPQVRIGHVGLGSEYIEQLDFFCPFLCIDGRTGRSGGLRPSLAKLARLKSAHKNKPMVPLMKLYWGRATGNTTEDVTKAIGGCLRAKLGFVLWYYSWVMHSPDDRYDRTAIIRAMRGEPALSAEDHQGRSLR